MDATSTTRLRAASILLVAGCVMFWAGAFTPPYQWWMGISVEDYLALIAANRGAWLWIVGAFAVGVLLTVAGFVVLGGVLRAAGDRVFSELGQTAFVLGGTLWLASLGFRATATVSAAQAAAAGGVPAWFVPARDWAGAMFALYMILAYLAIAAYGQALRAAALGPRWLARTHVVFGLAGAIGFVVRVPVFAPPLVIHLVPAIFGITMLSRLRRA